MLIGKLFSFLTAGFAINKFSVCIILLSIILLVFFHLLGIGNKLPNNISMHRHYKHFFSFTVWILTTKSWLFDQDSNTLNYHDFFIMVEKTVVAFNIAYVN